MTFPLEKNLQLFLVLLTLPICAFAQTNGNVSLGASLFAVDNSSCWLSASGDFAFGFRQLKNQDDLFLLCVWYAKIPDQTIVWYANGDRPAPRSSKLNLTSDPGLLLTNPQGQELWKSETIVGVVDHGVITDEGSFVLVDSNSSKLWETFEHPTDTLLPTQIMNRGGLLSSRQSETNFSKGRFQLRLQGDGDVVLNTINLPTNFANEPYYQSGTTGESNSSREGIQLVFNESGLLFVLRKDNERFNLTTGGLVSARDYYFRATLNFDGIFTQYYHRKALTGNVSWISLWSIPDNICDSMMVFRGVGVCGYNSICTLGADQRPTCECPKGYSLLDPNDVYGSCKPDFRQGCFEDELNSTKDGYDVVELTNTVWPTSDYVKLAPFTADMCKESCLLDCLCAVAILRDGDCWKKKLPLSNGRVDPKRNTIAFIKIPKGNKTFGSEQPSHDQDQGPIPDVKKENQVALIRVVSALLGTSIFINFILIGASVVGFLLIYKKKRQTFTLVQSVSSMNLRSFTYEELEKATDGFKEELGRGAFGTVFKGVLSFHEGNLQVAVKKLNNMVREREQEFKAEVGAIGRTDHKNLVRLMGFCNDTRNRILVYQFMSNGSLADFIFGAPRPKWNQRKQIALGTASGLFYLHEECNNQIIHCDIKPQNILLDDSYTARISDFGLAKILMTNQTRTTTGIRGTRGYVAPEWFRNRPVSVKVDVYSYGILLLEIIFCRKSFEAEVEDESQMVLADWAYDCFKDGKLRELLEDDDDAMEEMKMVENFVMVAIWCIQEDPTLRPTMKKVVQMLEGTIQVSIPPSSSSFSSTSS
ncbi:hypothetical protein UlMin_030424 [Ulmus minor]